MKKIFAVLLFATYSVVSNAQNFTNQEKRESALPSYKSQSTHGYLCRFIGFDVNDVMPELEMYLQEKLAMRNSERLSGVKDGWYVLAFSPEVSNSIKQRVLYVKTKIDKSNKITAMNITGDLEYVIKLFCYYWPTELDFESAKKKELVIVRNIDERISLNIRANIASIVVRKM
ncbi:MAG: hypothetical protein JSR11_03715 [Bacteroidetes bacterium]|nr:hypothetical protein [Bacteroidota bacterium]